MENKMLIDADHPEETRVVVVRGNRVEEFDFEAENKKQLRGNIYLAKVTRVEPSLQAAFVDYGGNRHGFLAFSEIHPDYYQIPVADRQALLEAEAEAHKANKRDEDDDETSDDVTEIVEEEDAEEIEVSSNADSEVEVIEEKATEASGEDEPVESEEEADVAAADETPSEEDTDDEPPTNIAMSAGSDDEVKSDVVEETETEAAETPEEGDVETEVVEVIAEATDSETDEISAEAKVADEEASEEEETPKKTRRRRGTGTRRSRKKTSAKSEEPTDETENGDDSDSDDQDDVESVGSEDAMEEVPERRSRPRVRQYKIQEVIKRRQIILVQVVKEERGNKGAALTTYLSLAGRYSVLMPNTDRGGGISRKITNQMDRKRLRTIANDLDVPEGMGVILRTAGASRTKTEIKRDFEYLMRLWETVRDYTMQSSAPALVYEEGSLLKRSIRDLYNKDIKQVIVSGDKGYREAKDFMRMLMPSHAKNVQPYKHASPIFAHFNVEPQLDAMFSPEVSLKSGGYIVINQTEALVSIDVNSGKSTRERSIEDTALSTNLEAAEEVARQLRLRDLAGLVVIDFIDMEEKRNNRAVERKMKECLKNDRARIQIGRISHFGLLEMSRQRIRQGVLESTMEVCPHCQGTGYVRSPSSVALYVLRAIEDYLIRGSKYNLIVKTKTAVALYVLNHKRGYMSELEQRFGLSILLEADETIVGDYCAIARGDRAEGAKSPAEAGRGAVTIDAELARDAELDAAAEAAERAQIENEEGEASEDDDGGRKRRRRRRKRRDDRVEASDEDADGNEEDGEVTATSEDEDDAPRRKRRRRGKRGGRSRDRNRDTETAASMDAVSEDDSETGDAEEDSSSIEDVSKTEENTVNAEDANGADPVAEETPSMESATSLDDTIDQGQNNVEETALAEAETTSSDEAKKPARGGWWQRRSFF